MNINHLSITWAVSRGRDTYGYNICRLDDRNNGKRYRTNGGGYDMIGTVFGDWLADNYQDRLKHITPHSIWDSENKKPVNCESVPNRSYGCTHYIDGKGYFLKAVLDGACGINSMIKLAEDIGLEVQWESNRKGHTIGFYVSEREEVTA
jgi:hypothetical protein